MVSCGWERGFELLIRIDPPRHHRRDLRKSPHPILTRFQNQLILRIRQISQYQSLHISHVSRGEDSTYMIDTARYDRYQIFQFYCPIFYFACTPKCLSYGIEEYIGWTSVHSHTWNCLIVHPQTIDQLHSIERVMRTDLLRSRFRHTSISPRSYRINQIPLRRYHSLFSSSSRRQPATFPVL
jgi:hypothetical protein